MPTRKMRVELFDNEGNRYTIAFEGQINREKALRLLDIVELLGGIPGGGASSSANTMSNNEISKYEKVHMILQRFFPVGWFYSREFQSVYEKEFKEPIGISTIATYLSRMSKKGILMKGGASNKLKYKLASSFSKTLIKQQVISKM